MSGIEGTLSPHLQQEMSVDEIVMSGDGDKKTLQEKSRHYITQGGLAIEVGTWAGESAEIIASVCRERNARLVCIDSFGGNALAYDTPKTEVLAIVMKRLAGYPVDFMVGNSTDIVRYLGNCLADFIFIDGDHTFPVVESDIRSYWDKLKIGGGFLMHDYTNPCDVKAACDSFFGINRVIHLPDCMGFVEKS